MQHVKNAQRDSLIKKLAGTKNLTLNTLYNITIGTRKKTSSI